MATKKRESASTRIDSEILEMAGDMHRIEAMDAAAHEKITLRHIAKAKAEAATFAPLTGEEIKALREQAHMSQAVFAKCLNLTTGYVSQLERGARRPTGPALVLLDVIRRLGIGAVVR